MLEYAAMDQPPDNSLDISQAASPSLLRRLAALFYDSLLLAALLVLAAALATPLIGEQGLHNPWARLAFQAYLVLVIYLYYAWHWCHGGQTLGMRAWRLRLLQMDGSALDWRAASHRFLAATPSLLLFGIGLLWCLFDRDGLAWHDRWTGSRLVITAKRP